MILKDFTGVFEWNYFLASIKVECLGSFEEVYLSL